MSETSRDTEAVKAVTKRPVGRPTKLSAEKLKQTAKLSRLGATDQDIADFLEVDVATIKRWAARDEKFCAALKVGKKIPNDKAERSLYHRATGYDYIEQQAFKIKTGNGNQEDVKVVEVLRHQPPDTAAAIFWLKNRRPDEWREKFDVNHTHNLSAEMEEFIRSLNRERVKGPIREQSIEDAQIVEDGDDL